jgi:predicted ribosome quality control (RQC) complex YloA/Tae2 family protein
MKINGRINYEELYTTLAELSTSLTGKFLKKVYHYEGYWQFNFNNIQIIIEPGYNIWIGEFSEREKDLHSLCIKFRKELTEQKVVSLQIVKDSRIFAIQFRDYTLVMELYAKGNIVLLDKNNTIIVLTRIYKEITHGNTYVLENLEVPVCSPYNLQWKSKHEFILTKEEGSGNILEQNTKLWVEKYKGLFKSKAATAQQPPKNAPSKVQASITRQIDEYSKSLTELVGQIQAIEENLGTTLNDDFEELNQLYAERKKMEEKLSKAHEHLVKMKPSKRSEKTISEKIVMKKWYHTYHWWITKQGRLVVGGRNADQNEKLVKSYLGEKDLYFHTETPGSGVFIMFTNQEEDLEKYAIDIHETASGVLALSSVWKNGISTGNVFYVFGSQVSKTPPSGEFITKGSFIINGKRNHIKVDDIALGYTVTPEKEIMLAPYSVVKRIGKITIKLTPKDGKKGNSKDISKKLKDGFAIQAVPECVYIFSHPCYVFLNKN